MSVIFGALLAAIQSGREGLAGGIVNDSRTSSTPDNKYRINNSTVDYCGRIYRRLDGRKSLHENRHGTSFQRRVVGKA